MSISDRLLRRTTWFTAVAQSDQGQGQFLYRRSSWWTLSVVDRPRPELGYVAAALRFFPEYIGQHLTPERQGDILIRFTKKMKSHCLVSLKHTSALFMLQPLLYFKQLFLNYFSLTSPA
ncbi:hypothetical protein [Paenibacillus humicus]|uniref:hypothetical protein n=1 Tax=Paenibacillus humicus TaxID=412861 RepID=UPI003D2C364C